MVPRKHQSKDFEILYENKDVVVGNKAAGSLAVAALWNKEDTARATQNPGDTKIKLLALELKEPGSK